MGILSQTTNRAKQVLCFSATMEGKVRGLIQNILSNPVKIDVSPENSTVESIDQEIQLIYWDRKNTQIKNLVAENSDGRTLVFVNSQRDAEKVAQELTQM
jgi:ATP-dependent RNA helicase RhlE